MKAGPTQPPAEPRKQRLLAISLVLLILVFGGLVVWHFASHHQSAVATVEYNAGYVDSAQCETCHADIAATYHQTGMGRSFYKPTSGNIIEHYASGNALDHQASGMRYTMLQRGGEFFQKRTTSNTTGEETNALEERVDYIIGSGTHARTYLHRAANGKLIELPVSWYTERSGYWAMSPGFDNAKQPDMHGAIGAECMFCHNGYPTLDAKAARDADEGGVFPANLPQGIDCQRCHGPGRDHVRLAQAKATEEQLRSSIVNPAHLPRERQLEVCFQCHLETSNRHTPAAVRLYDRDIFSYRPGQPLDDYKVYVERASKPKGDDFEIAHAGYQLPKSACFRNSQMTCLTCHDPHNIPHGKEAVAGYVTQCQSCHQAVKHTVALPATETCISCHMPKRRTEGSVHVVLTDHYIQRYRPLGDLLKPIAEQSFAEDHTPVEIYYPKQMAHTKAAELAMAIAQVDDNDGVKGLEKLRESLSQNAPVSPDPYLAMARTLVRRNRQADAITYFEKALAHQPGHRAAMREMAVALVATGQSERALATLRDAVAQHPDDDLLLTDLGNTYLRRNMLPEADDALHKAIAANPENGDAHNLLGLVAVARGDNARAQQAFQEAERLRPDLPEVYDNLGMQFVGARRYEEAAFQFRQALVKDAKDGEAHHGLGLVYLLQKQPARAEAEMRQAAALKPEAAQIHADLADLFAARNDFSDAATEYQSALSHNANLGDARLGLAGVLLQLRQVGPAVQQLQIAASSSDPAVSQQAREMLQRLVQ